MARINATNKFLSSFVDEKAIGRELRAARKWYGLSMPNASKWPGYKNKGQIGTLSKELQTIEVGEGGEILCSPFAVHYILKAWNTYAQIQEHPEHYPEIRRFIGMLTHFQDIPKVNLEHGSWLEGSDAVNIIVDEQVDAMRWDMQRRKAAAKAIRTFRKHELDAERPLLDYARELGYDRHGGYIGLLYAERGTRDPLTSVVATRYIMRYIAPKLGQLEPERIATAYLELYILLRAMYIPFGYEASLSTEKRVKVSVI